MGVTDVFSKRGKPAPDVYVYDVLPPALRTQIVLIAQDAIGARGGFWIDLAAAIAREHGMRELPCSPETRARLMASRRNPVAYDKCLDYIEHAETLRALDMIELIFRALDSELREARLPAHQTPDEAIEELNYRFREHGVGYQFERGNLFRVDAQFLHAEPVKSALALLSAQEFSGANEEFLRAHEHYRHERLSEAVSGACSAFESCMKVICSARGWSQGKGTASSLITAVITNGLLPEESREQLNALDKCLIGLSTFGNNNGRHGAGEQPRDLPPHYAAYALHLAATNIVFLVSCHNATSAR